MSVKGYWHQVFFLDEGNAAQKKVAADYRKKCDAILNGPLEGAAQDKALSDLAIERQTAWIEAGK